MLLTLFYLQHRQTSRLPLVSDTKINLSWNASTDNAGVTGYRIYRDGIQVADVSGTTYQDTGLSPSYNIRLTPFLPMMPQGMKVVNQHLLSLIPNLQDVQLE